MAALITFNAADIHLEGVEVDVALPPKWFVRVLNDTEVTPRTGDDPAGRITGRLSRSGNDIVVRVRVKADVEIPCVRCLEPAGAIVDAEMSLLLQPKRSARESKRGRRQQQAEEYEFTSEEADIDSYDGETVVLDSFVREVILLEVPNFPMCRESCPGITSPLAQTEAQEANALDPRLAPLNAFRDDDGPTTIDDLIAAANERAMAFGRKPVLRSNHAKKKHKKKSKKK